MDYRKKLGENIRGRRTALGISQEALAALAGLHRTYVSSVERGERNVSIDNIVKIAMVLECTPGQLLE